MREYEPYVRAKIDGNIYPLLGLGIFCRGNAAMILGNRTPFDEKKQYMRARTSKTGVSHYRFNKRSITLLYVS